jgi:tetratricopeptide (TPR) repeat protein
VKRNPNDQYHNDDELSAEEMRQLRRRQRTRRLLVFGLPAAALAAIATALAIPAVKSWRAGQFAERAEELVAEGKLQEAYNNASSAMQMRPGSPEVQRAYARVLIAAKESKGLQVMQRLIDSGEATPEDRLELAEAALGFGDISLAEKESFHLLQQGEETPEALYVLARVRLVQQRAGDAIQALNESLEAGGGSRPAILLARLQIAGGLPEALPPAVEILRPIARQKDEAGLEALMVLLASPALKSPEASEWIEALRAHPLASDGQKLAAAEAEIQRNPANRPEIVKKTIAAYRSGSAPQRAELARWLNQNREYDMVLDVITPEEASSRTDLFLIRLDAMAGNGDWAGLAELLQRDKLPLQRPVAFLYRGRAARELGRPEESSTFYRRAIVEAAPTRDTLRYVIAYLQRVGEDRVLEQELRKLAQNPAFAREAFAALVPIVQKRQDAEELYLLYDAMLKRLPADSVVQNDHRYFAALTGRRTDVTGARELLAAEPRMLAYRVTLSLAHLKNGQPEAAMQVFDGITLDPAQIQPYQRAVLAAVLGTNGRQAEARQLARSVPGDAVTVQEFELITPWREDPVP